VVGDVPALLLGRSEFIGRRWVVVALLVVRAARLWAAPVRRAGVPCRPPGLGTRTARQPRGSHAHPRPWEEAITCRALRSSRNASMAAIRPARTVQTQATKTSRSPSSSLLAPKSRRRLARWRASMRDALPLTRAAHLLFQGDHVAHGLVHVHGRGGPPSGCWMPSRYCFIWCCSYLSLRPVPQRFEDHGARVLVLCAHNRPSCSTSTPEVSTAARAPARSPLGGRGDRRGSPGPSARCGSGTPTATAS
jgi:hypothetical protein